MLCFVCPGYLPGYGEDPVGTYIIFLGYLPDVTCSFISVSDGEKM